jgi:CRP-like cAMP-binding protein
MLGFRAMASEPAEVWGDLATSAFVQSSLLFKSLEEDAREDLLRLATVQRFAPGEVVFHQGDSTQELYLVRDGAASVLVAAGGDPREVTALERGAFFGEAQVLTGQPHAATVVARTELAVVRFPAPVIAALAGRYPKLGRLLEAMATARRRDAAAKTS